MRCSIPATKCWCRRPIIRCGPRRSACPAASRCIMSATSRPAGCRTSTTSRRRSRPTPKRSSSSIRTIRPARCIRSNCCEQIVELARQHQLIVFADEIYDKVLYDGADAHLDRLAGRRRAVHHLQRPVEELPFLRLSRRLDGGVGREEACQGLHRRPEHAGLDAPVRERARPVSRSRPRWAAIRASTTWSRPGGRLLRQRDLAHKLLTDIPGVTCVKPKSALYMFPRLDPEDVSDRRRPAVCLRTAGRRKGADRAGHRFQLADHRSFPRRVPAEYRTT